MSLPTPPAPTPAGDANPDFDDAIPLLTEVIEVGDAPEPMQTDLPPDAAREAHSDAAWTASPVADGDEVAGRLAARAQQYLDASLPEMIDVIVAGVGERLRADLRDAIMRLAREAVAQAIDEARAEHAEHAAQAQSTPPDADSDESRPI